MRIAVLGPVEAHRDSPVDLGTRKQRALVAALALHRGRPVPVDTLVDLLWRDTPPPGVAGTLQAYVAGLRRGLEPDRPARAPATVLVTRGPGYALELDPADLDVVAFEEAAAEAHRALAGASPIPDGAPAARLTGAVLDDAAGRLEDALTLWRGTPFAELDDAPAVLAERARLEELRLLAVEDLAVARLAQGQHGAAAAELEALTAAHPLRERLWALRAVALTRAGRQADALAALRQVRDLLADELGLEPGPELRHLTTAILRQDPALAWTPPATKSRGNSDATTKDTGPAQPVATSEAAAGTVTTQDATGQARSRTAAVATAPAAAPLPHAWPLAGRDRELAALTDLLDQAGAGTPAFAVVTGEPGIGKSRLVAELAGHARPRGARVLIGRCSQDDGAPPLYPWAAVLGGLGQDLPLGVGEEDEGAAFRTWERIVTALTAAAADAPVLVVLDDLHWADPASLRVLRLLGETVETGRLLVLATWREEATGEPLAAVAETLARRHAVRLHLDGLERDAAAAVVTAVAGTAPDPAATAALCERTGGNAFFLVEYARLAGERGDLAALLAEPDPPAAVRDVLRRRLDRLPQTTMTALRAAAVVGRRFDLATAAAAASTAEDDLLDALEPALAAGLVREEGVDSFAFAHALVRDTLWATLPASRRARVHARVAAHLEPAPGHETQTAHHWLRAGPNHAARAWRAAVAAAAAARRLHAHDDAAELLRSAREALAADPGATARDRYAVLMTLAEAHRWAGDWAGLAAASRDAAAVAEELGDVELLARAACAPTTGALWQLAEAGMVSALAVATLRRVLVALPPGDGAPRCRVMLSLAAELYYAADVPERRDLVAGALAMARRLGDDALLLDAYPIAFVALWHPATREERLGWATAAAQLATRLGDDRAVVLASCLLAAVQGELGLVAEMWRTVAAAREHATRLRLPFPLLVLDNLELPWLAMGGRFDEAEQRMADIEARHRAVSLPLTSAAVAGTRIALRIWQDRSAEIAPLLLGLEGGYLPVTASVLVHALRAGDRERARAHLAAHPVTLEHDTWFSMLDWGMAGEAALGLGDAELGAAAHAKLAPYAGQVCCAGGGNASGPVDMYLAMAAFAAGRFEEAMAHADRAEELCAAWEIPLAAARLRRHRERHGF
ncbi:BTAD domain-containing putative transcriptional regulator [Georgenia ruanii]|uniref:BTAD domain-containing putative transcriptional regulator n=1 Tax=Georgenia ruanii TaxID=348442 RepID=UPI00186B4AAF|nr:BTAD domain-containing putative transcriptional regulator [Georgenia ruanii]